MTEDVTSIRSSEFQEVSALVIPDRVTPHARGEHRPMDEGERLFSCSRALARSLALKE